MDFSLTSPRSRWFLLAICTLIPAAMVYQAVELWIADHRVNSGNFALMQRGARMVPGDGDAWDRLGEYSQTNFSNPDPDAAIRYYRKALQDDPRSATGWMDLASAYEDIRQVQKAGDAYARARAAYPISAEVSWKYGNFLLRNGDTPHAYPQIRHAVEVTPSYLPLAIASVWHAGGSIDDLLGQVLPPTVAAYSQALDFFVSIQRADLCLTVWRRLMALRSPILLSPSSLSFFDLLIAQGRSDDAQRAWAQAVSAAGVSSVPASDGSLIWDGSFRAAFTNGGLGWRWNRTDNVSIDFDAPPAGLTGRSVRVDFEGGANVSLDSPFEFVPVKPGAAYHFHALLRTGDITTDSGVKFSISDPDHPHAVNIVTANFTGTHAWAPIDFDVTTSTATNFLVVQLLRAPSQAFDNKITGSAWIADISLRSAVAQAAKAPLP